MLQTNKITNSKPNAFISVQQSILSRELYTNTYLKTYKILTCLFIIFFFLSFIWLNSRSVMVYSSALFTILKCRLDMLYKTRKEDQIVLK